MADTAEATAKAAAITRPDDLVGRYVVVRCRDAGVHAGTLASLEGNAVTLTGSRRLWYWKAANKTAFLSGVASEGLDHKASKIGVPIDIVLTETSELIPCTERAATSIAECPSHEAR